jgi:hypothetical protein
MDIIESEPQYAVLINNLLNIGYQKCVGIIIKSSFKYFTISCFYPHCIKIN